MANKPAEIFEWATTDINDPITGLPNVEEPEAIKKEQGWAHAEAPPARWFNWLFRIIQNWIEYFVTQTDENKYNIFMLQNDDKIDIEINSDNTSIIIKRGTKFIHITLENDFTSIIETMDNELTLTLSADSEYYLFHDGAEYNISLTSSMNPEIDKLRNGFYENNNKIIAFFNTNSLSLISSLYIIDIDHYLENYIERIGANQYKIKDNVISLYVRNIPGGHKISNILKETDTWGVIQTNNCTKLEFESGAYIFVVDTASYMEVNTDDAVLENVWIKGLGVTANSISQSFVLNAYRVRFENCKTSNRISNVDFAGFQASSILLHNQTSEYINCSVFTITTVLSDFYGFKGLCNTKGNCIVYDITSGGKTIYGYSNSEKYEVISEDITLETNKKYFVNGSFDLKLPKATIGDTLELFCKYTGNLLQGDTETLITYLNKYFTTKGTAGKLIIPIKSSIELVYIGNSGSIILPGTKLSNPATIPSSQAWGCGFSHNGIYFAITYWASPYVLIYRRSGDTFTKLPNPATLPTGGAYQVAFSYDDNYLAVSHQVSPYITIYSRDGDNFTKLPDPSILPTGNAFTCAFSYDDTYLAVAHVTSPYITIYKREGDTFTKLANPSSLPPDHAFGCAFSYDGNYLAVTCNASPYLLIYRRSGDIFTKLPNPATLPAGVGEFCAFSYDGKYLAVPHDGSPYITIYRRDGDTFTKLPNPSILPTGKSYGCAFSYNGNYLAVSHLYSPYMTIYERYEDTFTKLPDPAILPSYHGHRCAFSYDDTYLAGTHDASPYIIIYKNLVSADKTWLVKEINTLYEQNLEYIFK